MTGWIVAAIVAAIMFYVEHRYVERLKSEIELWRLAALEWKESAKKAESALSPALRAIHEVPQMNDHSVTQRRRPFKMRGGQFQGYRNKIEQDFNQLEKKGQKIKEQLEGKTNAS